MQKIKIEINESTFNKIKEIFELGKNEYESMNIRSIDDFISYILENFSSSSKQFEKLNDQMKNLMGSIDLNNLNFEDLFKNIAKTSLKKSDSQDEENKKSNFENKKN